MRSHLHSFLSSSTHSTERERLLHLTALRDLKLYAAVHGERVMITEPELDIEGFDFVISNAFEMIHLQSKATLICGGKRRWKVRAALIKASMYNRDLMPNLDGLPVSGFSTGATGGVLLHVIDADGSSNESLKISYRYLDIYWLIGVASGVAGQSRQKRERALTFLREIRDANDSAHIELRFGDFACLRSITDIALLRLHIGGMSNWASACHQRADLTNLNEPNLELSTLWPGRDLCR